MGLKSISSFLATILLISFTISTGVIIYYFFTTFPRTQMQEVSGLTSKVLSCAGAMFEVKVIECNLMDGLVLWLPMDEESGDIVYDLSGNGNNGTIYGATRVNEGFVRALSFDGVDDYVIANPVNVDYLTISAWVQWHRFYEDSAGHAVISNSNSAQDGYMLYQAVSAPYNRVRAFVYTTSTFDITSTTLLETNTWYHIVVTYDGSFFRLYINGILDRERTVSGTIKPTTNPFLIGSTYVPGGVKFNGTIDEVLIFNRALSEEEIKFLYEEGLKKLQNSGMVQFNSRIKPCIAISNPSGKIYVDNLRVGNQNSKEIKLIKPLYNLELESNFRFSKGTHQIKIENVGFNFTSKRPIIRISEK